MAEKDTSVKVAVRIRPLNDYEAVQDSSVCLDVVQGDTQIRAGPDAFFTFDYVFGSDTIQQAIYDDCVSELLDAAFEGFNATILAYGQTGSGKTFTMGSAADGLLSDVLSDEALGIIPRVIKKLFQMIRQKEEENSRSTFKVYVQFLEIYGEDIKDLLDQTKTSKVAIRETRSGEVFVTGAKEELVSSFEQMRKALEDGTKNRTTASTKMNQTSSRSHAIFTVNLEHTIHSEVVKEQNGTDCDTPVDADRLEQSSVVSQEVRKCKFHFVDLAGSERAKRTGAQGQQLKEGIDINKGLLALGNVISALGDEQKKGKVFVPYRDSKLTRMLQDSLGGNSKTLMICCVSPASVNYNESLNALRYANRARNIKNKPVVNRDPTMILIDELRSSLTTVATELLEIKKKKQYVETNPNITVGLLEEIVKGTATGASTLRGGAASNKSIDNGLFAKSTSSAAPSKTSSAELKRLKQAHDELEQQLFETQTRLRETEFEMQRQTEQLKLSRLGASQISDQLHLAISERDFFHIKWADACPAEAQLLERLSSDAASFHRSSGPGSQRDEPAALDPQLPPILQEKLAYTQRATQLMREIEELKSDLAKERAGKIAQLESLEHTELMLSTDVDTEFTSTITALLAQTRTQLIEESRKLNTAALAAVPEEGDEDDDENNENENSALAAIAAEDKAAGSAARLDVAEDEKVFIKRQRLLTTEVEELGQSIQLKEQLMAQLLKSQQKYSVMKSFYEQKLSQMSTAMLEKQAEREKLLAELAEITEKTKTEQPAPSSLARETKLREDLKSKDDELLKLQKKTDQLRSITNVQGQYSHQVSKLERDITAMKKQRVDLAKTLQQEKKNYVMNLSEKAKEIDRLKKELAKAAVEVKRLGRSKELAESKAKDALREGAAFKRKAQELMKSHHEINSASEARAAIRAIHKTTARLGGAKYLSEEELRVKKWLDQRISEISAREAAADALKRQYEQQLELLQRKEALERERDLAMSKADVSQKRYEGESFSVPSTPQREHRDASGCDTPVLSAVEEDQLLELLEDRLSSINGQLSARNQKINDMARQINESSDVAGASAAMEFLTKRATSVPAALEIVRMLFDMLVASGKSLKLQSAQLDELAEKERALSLRVEDLQVKLAAEKRAYDMEITTVTHDFEQKLQDFLQHIAPEAHLSLSRDSEEDDRRHLSLSLSGPSSPVNSALRRTLSTPLSRGVSFDPTDVQLAVSAQENKLLKTQLEREKTRGAQLEGRVADLEKIKFTLMADIEEKSSQIKFLEEDRELFKHMSEELKMGLNSLGKEGKAVVMNAMDRLGGRRGKGLFAEYMRLNDEEDETQSVIGEFENLADEINRTGFVSHTKPAEAREDIFHRLNDPSNYTGRMRSIFKDDVTERRRKVQESRAHMEPRRHSGDRHHQPKKDHKDKEMSLASYSSSSLAWKPKSEAQSVLYLSDDNEHCSNSHALSIDVSDGDLMESISPDPPSAPANVFTRLASSRNLLQRKRDTITPRNTSPSSSSLARTFDAFTEPNSSKPPRSISAPAASKQPPSTPPP